MLEDGTASKCSEYVCALNIQSLPVSEVGACFHTASSRLFLILSSSSFGQPQCYRATTRWLPFEKADGKSQKLVRGQPALDYVKVSPRTKTPATDGNTINSTARLWLYWKWAQSLPPSSTYKIINGPLAHRLISLTSFGKICVFIMSPTMWTESGSPEVTPVKSTNLALPTTLPQCDVCIRM